MNLQKIIIFINIFFLSFISAFWEGNSTITSISYSWNLIEDVVVNLNWTNLSSCFKLQINRVDVDMLSVSESRVTFSYLKYNKILKWNIVLNCSSWEVIYEYKWPYINWATINKPDYSSITIEWTNLWTSWNVVLDWWNFSYSSWQDNKITWNLPESLSSNEFYVVVWWLKSNLINLDLKLPHIKLVTSNNWFYNWETVTIYWDNLNSYDETTVLYNWEEVETFIWVDWSVNFILDDSKIWINKIKIKSDKFVSNEVQIDVKSSRYLIEKVEEDFKDWKMLVVTLNKQPLSIPEMTLYNNNRALQIDSINWNDLYVKNYKLEYPDNFLQLKLNDTFSNSFYYKNTAVIPYIWDVVIWPATSDNKRLFELFLYDYSIENDYLYFNNSRIYPEWCDWINCRVLLPSTALKWTFSIWTKDYKNDDVFDFDITFDKDPIFDRLEVNWDLESLTNIKIFWENLKWSKITTKNLFSSDTSLKVTDTTIEWTLIFWYDSSKTSSLSISKNGYTESLVFNLNTVNLSPYSTLYWVAKIKDVISDTSDWLFKPWTKVKLIWKWFHSWDKVIIWTQEVNFDFINKTFTIPVTISPWVTSFSIKNSSWIISDKESILVVNPDYKPNVIFKYDSTEPKTYDSNTIKSSDKLYTIQVENNYKDIRLNKIWFHISSTTNYSNVWWFKLAFNWKDISKWYVNENWYLEFTKPFNINVSNSDQEISIYKVDYYSVPSSFSINLDTNSLDAITSNINNKFNNFSFDNFLFNKITVSSPFLVTCYDSLNSDDYCREYLSNWIKEEQTTVTESTNTTQNTVKQPASNTSSTKKYSINIESKSKIIKSAFISKKNLDSTRKYKKYIWQIDEIIPVLSERSKVLVQLYKKLDTLPQVWWDVQYVIDYLKWKVWIEIYNKDDIEIDEL